MKKINWIQEKYDTLTGKIDDYTLFTLVESQTIKLNQGMKPEYALIYWLCIKLPITSLEERYRDAEDNTIAISDKNKDILIEKAELMYKTFYETIQ